MARARIANTASRLDPHTPTEILGRGEGQRKTKTFLESTEAATLLAKIGAYPKYLSDLFRRLHAATHDETYEIDGDDGPRHVTRPEVLTDDELRAEYPVIKAWEEIHQELVAHSASVSGFSVVQAIKAREDRLDDQEESSAESERDSPDGTREGRRWR